MCIAKTLETFKLDLCYHSIKLMWVLLMGVVCMGVWLVGVVNVYTWIML